eukprot:TRINITY_DN76432_c0_g1_i1.p1 TRINITY_DN76432_c0_g1~~TRINITY_DN76432_c0_g1_i1.p1  ORF type:complete len:547 (+),score=76.42 TRINITY_DN76432_c0_g1_i1:50-1642(+)
MLRIAAGALVFLTACAQSHVEDPTPLAEHEKYLEPYLNDLVSYRDNPIARRFISLANLVDVVPTWLEDLFVPLFIPDSTLKLALKFEVPLPDPTGIFPGITPGIAHLEVDSVSINNLDEFKKLKPAKFQDNTRFTWAGQVEWKESKTTTLQLEAKLVIFKYLTVRANVAVTVKDPAIDFAAVVAFDREKMCDVWGHVLESSGQCALWPLFVNADDGVSGVNFTSLILHASDFVVDKLELGGPLPFGLGDKLEEFLIQAIESKKPDMLSHLSDSVSEQARQLSNAGLLTELPLFHEYYPCSIDEITPKHVDASTVCFTNNAAFAMKWGYANCPTHQVSQSSRTFPIDQHECMHVLDIWPDAKEGQVLRAQLEAIAGMHEIVDPALRYVPNSNVAAFRCDGSTFIYKCELVSVAPEDPSVPVPASQLCLLNHGGYVMHYDAQDQRTGKWIGQSDSYPIEQTRCSDLSTLDDVQAGDEFQIKAHAVLGQDVQTDRTVVYQAGGPKVTFECSGGTWTMKCKLLAKSDALVNIVV